MVVRPRREPIGGCVEQVVGDGFVVDRLEHSKGSDVRTVAFVESRVVGNEHAPDGGAVGVGNELSRVPVLVKGVSAD